MLQLTFRPESEEFKSATEEYREIWQSDGRRIVAAFKEVAGLEFQQQVIEVVVYEGVSRAGNLVRPMKLRASYSYDVKQATLVHELGHRLIRPLRNRLEGLDEHRHLNLFLYQVWIKLYGQQFADKMVEVESARQGLYDYEAAWQWYLQLSPEKRSELWSGFVNLNRTSF